MLGIHHDLFASEAAVQASGAADRALETLRGKGLVYEGALERPKSLDPHDEWEPAELHPVPLDPSSATTRTGR